jgi:hypothetical protein
MIIVNIKGVDANERCTFINVICDRYTKYDRLRGLVVRVLGYRSGGPGSIPGTTIKK